MDLAVAPTRTLRWWTLVYAAAITPIDVERLGLVTAGGPDLVKWALRVPVWFLPLVVLAPRWGTLFQALRRPPTSWLLAWATLGACSVAWALAPSQALLIGLAGAGLVTLSTWYVFTAGWHEFATAVVVGLTISLAVGMLLDFIDSTFVTGRSVGLASGPTAQGRIAAFNIVLVAGVIWSRRSSLMFWAVPFLSAAALLASETRTAMAAALLGLLYGGLRRLSPLYRVLVVLALGLGLFSVLGIASAVTDVVAFGERGDPTSVAGRTSIWPVAIDFIMERPILGYGWGASERLFAQAARTGDLTFLAGTSHSIVLAPLVQGGIVGVLADYAAVAACGTTLPDGWLMATTGSQTHNLAPATGDLLVAVAEVVRSGRRHAVARCDVYNDNTSESPCLTGLFTATGIPPASP